MGKDATTNGPATPSDARAADLPTTAPQPLVDEPLPNAGDLSELLQEMRVLITGVQVLVGFLVILPFSQGFPRLDQSERWVYLVAFICALTSLVLFMAPAAQHRLERPLRDRVRFKQYATALTIAGLAALSLALILTTHLVVSYTVGYGAALIVSAVIAVLIGVVWWVWPLRARYEARHAG